MSQKALEPAAHQQANHNRGALASSKPIALSPGASGDHKSQSAVEKPSRQMYLFDLKRSNLKNIDLIQYSKMKYGDRASTDKYGIQLATHFIEKEGFTCEKSSQYLFASSAYRHVPVAATWLFRKLVDALQDKLNCSSGAISSFKIERKSLTSGDFSKMEEKARKEAMDKTELEIDDTLIHGKTLVILDDVVVTGSHEENIKKYLRGKSHAGSIFFYIAKINPEEKAKIEDEINSKAMTGISDWIQIAKDSPYITVRYLKYVLENDKIDFTEFQQNLPLLYRQALEQIMLMEDLDQLLPKGFKKFKENALGE
ncbi:unnamed protein product [Didymodactylos carnosus]|nr:unnamed protein product [Didymodactylos carnosus]CAF3999159.1 unnamed protein product [Didymodactylos carnosus]